MSTEYKIKDFGKLTTGAKFYLSNPMSLPEVAYYTKTDSQKDVTGKWNNATNAFGIPTFVQYDKRVWSTQQ